MSAYRFVGAEEGAGPARIPRPVAPDETATRNGSFIGAIPPRAFAPLPERPGKE
jgi:hypothetical protein